MPSTFSVRDLMERFGVSEHTVLMWIKSGELRAVNVGRTPGAKKPRWRVRQEDIAQFELGREAGPPPTKPTRRKKQSSEVIQFYA